MLMFAGSLAALFVLGIVLLLILPDEVFVFAFMAAAGLWSLYWLVRFVKWA
jgi:hypothetical protein